MQQSVDQEAQSVIADKDFDNFLDQLMFKLYDTVQEYTPAFIIPTLTTFRRANYGEEFKVFTVEVPPTQADKQIATLETIGASAADGFSDGTVPAAAFLITEGKKLNPKLGTELSEKEIRDSEEEVILVSGATIDGRLCKAIYLVTRNDKDRIVGIDLKVYIPARQQQTEKSTLVDPLLEAFYRGYVLKYAAIAEAQRAEDGGERHGDFILPT